MTSRCGPDALVAHTKAIRLAAARLARRRASARAAELDFYAAVREAFDAGLSVDPIHRAAGISVDRAYQVKNGRTGHAKKGKN